MDQKTQLETGHNQLQKSYQLLQSGKRIAFIQAAWHSNIVDQSRISFVSECARLGIDESKIDGTKELEIIVDDFEKTNEILNKLGYEYRAYQCHICL